MSRILLFLGTNLAVMVVFSIILTLLGVDANSTMPLLIIASLFGFGGALISLLLSKKMALRSVGGKVIDIPKNEQERWLVDVVRNLSSKAGIGMPTVAIYNAPDANAFATGAKKDSALVAVSTGLLTSMTKDEVEAVLAHEISHISNGDMVTMTLLQGVLNTFVIFVSRLLAQVISSILSSRSNDSNDSRGSIMLYYPIAMALEFVFGILASIIAMWFSRHREFKADAGAAMLVGPDKMIAALRRLKEGAEPKENATVMAFCINGPRRSFAELFMSHPPLEVRIEALQNRTHLPNNSKMVS